MRGFNAKLIMLFITGVNGRMEILLPRYTSSAIVIYCFGPQKSAVINNLLERRIIDIGHLRRQQLADETFPVTSCNLHVIKVCTILCHEIGLCANTMAPLSHSVSSLQNARLSACH